MSHCGIKGCRCTHSEGCEFGWVELEPKVSELTLQTYTPVAPCPICRPDAYDRYVGSITRGSVAIR